MKFFLFLLIYIPFSIGWANGQNAVEKCFPKEHLFSLGSYYYPEQWNELQWERDLKKMAEMGIEFTHFNEFAWSLLEPEEGVYDFGWLDRAISIAAKYGLKVIMCTPSPTPPVWLSKKYPDILVCRDNGVSLQHGRRQHASWSSDRYCEYVKKIATKLAERYGHHPAVIGWQIDNEPGHYGVVDYSDNAQRKFRYWLQSKYGNIERLNEVWGNVFWSEKYQGFEQIRLPSWQEVVEKPNPHAMLDMNRFQADEVSRFVHMQAQVLKLHICDEQWVTTNLIPIFNPIDPVRFDQLDFLTYTRYPVSGWEQGIGIHGFRIGAPEFIGFPNDQFRNRIGKTFGVMELQPGQVNWGIFNPQPMPGAVRMWTYHVFAGGGKFVCNYRFRQPLRGGEQYHYGMMMTDGTTLSTGGKEYMQVANELKVLREAYDPKVCMPSSLSARKTALLFDMNNYWEEEHQPQTNQWNTMRHIYTYYNLLKSMAVPVDIISEKETFDSYSFIVAPAYQLLDNFLIERWTKYVRNGGHLILTCRTGQKDREAKLWEAPFAAPIRKLAGISELFYDHLPTNIYGKITSGGKNYEWNNWGDVITPAAETEVWATYLDQFYAGKAVVVHRQLGKGTVTYIGVDTDDRLLEKDIMRRVYVEAGLQIEDLPYGVVKEWRDGFFIILNYTSDTQLVHIPQNADILVGSKELEPCGVTIYKIK